MKQILFLLVSFEHLQLMAKHGVGGGIACWDDVCQASSFKFVEGTRLQICPKQQTTIFLILDILRYVMVYEGICGYMIVYRGTWGYTKEM